MNAIRSIAELQIQEVIYKGSMSRVEVASLREGPLPLAAHTKQQQEGGDRADNNGIATASSAPQIALKTYDKATLTPRARCVSNLPSALCHTEGVYVPYASIGSHSVHQLMSWNGILQL